MTIINATGKYERSALINEASRNKKTDTPEKKSDASTARKTEDRVSLSETSRDAAIAKNAVENTPEIRAERVEELKREVEEGRYQVEPERVAGKMVGTIISEVI